MYNPGEPWRSWHDSLRFVSGYAGLVATHGFTEFRSFRITGSQYQGTLGGLKKGTRATFRRVQHVETVGRNFRIYDPERRTFFLIDEAGKVLEFDRASSAPALQTSADFNGTTFTIVGATNFRNDGGIIAELTSERLVAPAALLTARDTSLPIVLYVTDSGTGMVLGFNREGRNLGGFGASSTGGFTAPRGLAWYGENEIVVADYDRLVIVPATLKEEFGMRTVPRQPFHRYVEDDLPYPFITASGTSFATFRAIPAPSTTSTTLLTSL